MGSGKGNIKRINIKKNSSNDIWLHKNNQYRKIINHKISASNKELVIFVKKQEQKQRSRYGIVTSKKIGNAVTRNKIKRVLRELITNELPKENGFDYVIITRKECVNIYENEGINGLRRNILDVKNKIDKRKINS